LVLERYPRPEYSGVRRDTNETAPIGMQQTKRPVGMAAQRMFGAPAARPALRLKRSPPLGRAGPKAIVAAGIRHFTGEFSNPFG
jgi:hypothetical protein